jgi:hypothetical protein
VWLGYNYRRRVGEHASESLELSKKDSPFCRIVKVEAGSGSTQGLLTAPRRISPGAVASKGPVKSFCWVAITRYTFTFLHRATGRVSRTISTNGDK